MVELEEVRDDIQYRIKKLEKEQMDRFNKSVLNAPAFLSLDREEEFTRRILQLIKALEAIEQILLAG